MNKHLKTIQKTLKELGASLIGFSLAAIVIISFAIVIIDFARIQWIQSSVRHALSQTLKRAQGDDRLYANIWTADSGESTATNMQNFQAARSELDDYFQNSPEFKSLRQSGTIKFLDNAYVSSNTEGDPLISPSTGKKLAYLPPGYKAQVTDSNNTTKTIGNSHKADRDPSKESLRGLSSTYPTELSASVEIPTLFFGKKVVEVKVAGFPRLAVTEGVPVTTTTGNVVVIPTTTTIPTVTTTTRTTTTATSVTTTTRTTTTVTTTSGTTTTSSTVTTTTTTTRTTTTGASTTTTTTRTTTTVTTATTTTRTTTTATTTTRTTTTRTTITTTTTTTTRTSTSIVTTSTGMTTTTGQCTCPPPGECGAGCTCDPNNNCAITCVGGCPTTANMWFTASGDCLMATAWGPGDGCCPESGCDVEDHGCQGWDLDSDGSLESWYVNVSLQNACPSSKGQLLGDPLQCPCCPDCPTASDCVPNEGTCAEGESCPPVFGPGIKGFGHPTWVDEFGNTQSGPDTCYCLGDPSVCPPGYRLNNGGGSYGYTGIDLSSMLGCVAP